MDPKEVDWVRYCTDIHLEVQCVKCGGFQMSKNLIIPPTFKCFICGNEIALIQRG